MFSGFMVIRNVFPMIIAAAVWLPLILTAIELFVRRLGAGRSCNGLLCRTCHAGRVGLWS